MRHEWKRSTRSSLFLYFWLVHHLAVHVERSNREFVVKRKKKCYRHHQFHLFVIFHTLIHEFIYWIFQVYPRATGRATWENRQSEGEGISAYYSMRLITLLNVFQFTVMLMDVSNWMVVHILGLSWYFPNLFLSLSFKAYCSFCGK